MAGEKPDVLMVGARKPVMMKGFEGKVNLHHWLEIEDKDAFVKKMAARSARSRSPIPPTRSTIIF
ncbi:MAG TPA: hypothetical protein VFX32_05570 [Pseudolabrys sp.]|nr:hypothetical protein [Pseudolabrys sp.]